MMAIGPPLWAVRAPWARDRGWRVAPSPQKGGWAGRNDAHGRAMGRSGTPERAGFDAGAKAEPTLSVQHKSESDGVTGRFE